MKTESNVGQLLRWRLTQAEAAAPPAPRAARLLELARPWWELWPERFEAAMAQLNATQFVYGHAMSSPPRARESYPVPVVIATAQSDYAASARVLFVSAREGRLRLRFELNAGAAPEAAVFEATFVVEGKTMPQLDGTATRSVGNEYRIEAEIPAEFQASWAELKATDRMPFRLILRPASGETHTPLS